jgi:hypothetical protein
MRDGQGHPFGRVGESCGCGPVVSGECAAGRCGVCRTGDRHGRRLWETCVMWPCGSAAAFRDLYNNPTWVDATVGTPQRYNAAFVWHAGRTCRQSCRHDCHGQDRDGVQLALFPEVGR